MDKKVSVKYWSMANNITPGISKNATWSDVWEILAEWGGFEGGVDTKADGSTTMDVWIEGQKVKVLPIKDGWNEKERDWNWHEVFSQTLDYIFEEGLIKKPRARRKDAKKEKSRKPVINRTKICQISREEDKVNNSIAEGVAAQNKRDFEAQWYSEKNLTELKKKLNNLSVRKNGYKKKGKDVSEIDAEMIDIREKISDIKKHMN